MKDPLPNALRAVATKPLALVPPVKGLQYVGEVVIGEEGFTKGWTVVRWRKDLPPVPTGTKLYAELDSSEAKEDR